MSSLEHPDWRALDAGVSAWFAAPSLTAGAALARRVADLAGGTVLPDIDLRPGGLRVRMNADSEADPGAISRAAQELGLTADPAELQAVGLVFETADRPALESFWQAVLGYWPVGADTLADPLRRGPALSFHDGRPGPLRERFHVDVVRAAATVEAVRDAVGQQPAGPYGLRLADADGNEVDLVPGGDLEDFQTLFAAVAAYTVDTPAAAAEFAATVAALADEAGVPLLIDLRPGGVIIDSGKDLWEDGGAARPEFVGLAGRIRAAAAERGLPVDPAGPRFVQVGLDAVDVPAVRAFWTAVLGYRPDPREFLTDIVDPRRLDPVLFIQPTEAADTERLAQRGRIRVRLSVPHDRAQDRVEAGLAVGGRVVAGRANTLADPEGNEIEIVG